jgi:HSP20 family protein
VATLVRWEPFRELASLQTEMSRLMNGLFEGDGRTLQSWVPAVDVWETDNEVVYAFDLPGIPEDKISVELHDDTLTVSGEREHKDERSEDGFYRYERRHGSFSRTLGVPQGITEDAIKADYKNGVLEIRIAKPEIAKPRRIQVGGSSGKSVESGTIEGTAPEA